MNLFIEKKKRNDDEMLAKFCIILNEKKKKLRELQSIEGFSEKFSPELVSTTNKRRKAEETILDLKQNTSYHKREEKKGKEKISDRDDNGDDGEESAVEDEFGSKTQSDDTMSDTASE